MLQLGKWNAEEVEKWSKQQLVQSIFIPGISTSDIADFTAGRGVGMDIVKTKIEKIEGKIDIETVEGQFTNFIITIPEA